VDSERGREQIAELVVRNVESFQTSSGVEKLPFEGAQLVAIQVQLLHVHDVDKRPLLDVVDVVERQINSGQIW
jgi:hypothetical protein